jgi:hypothetical protein
LFSSEVRPVREAPLYHKKDARRGLDYKISKQKNKKTKKKIYLASPLVTLPQIQTAETLLPQTAVLDEPNTLDLDTIDVPTITSDNDSEGSCVEIVDGGSDADVCEETVSPEGTLTRYRALTAALWLDKGLLQPPSG